MTTLRDVMFSGVDMSHVAPLTLANLSSSLVSLHLETCYLGEAHGG
ncbi:hypothetical protein Golax_017516 [Gossypium laxum]|nr:hypothetical protein [Gossypium laxum]